MEHQRSVYVWNGFWQPPDFSLAHLACPSKTFPVECQRHRCGDAPTDRPRHPDAGGAEETGEHEGKGDAQHEVGEGGDHELLHETGSAKDAVCHQLCRDDKVKRRYDPQEGHAAGERIFRAVVHKQQQPIASGEEVKQEKRDGQQPYQLQTGAKAFAYPIGLVCAHILRRVVGDAGSERGKGGNHEVVQLDGSGISGNHAGAEAVDDALNKNISHRDKALLQDTRNSDNSDFLKQRSGKQRDTPPRGNRPQSFNYYRNCEDTAHTLAEEGCPGDTGNAHVKGGHKQDVHRDIRCGGDRQEPERCPGISECGENTG